MRRPPLMSGRRARSGDYMAATGYLLLPGVCLLPADVCCPPSVICCPRRLCAGGLFDCCLLSVFPVCDLLPVLWSVVCYCRLLAVIQLAGQPLMKRVFEDEVP